MSMNDSKIRTLEDLFIDNFNCDIEPDSTCEDFEQPNDTASALDVDRKNEKEKKRNEAKKKKEKDSRHTDSEYREIALEESNIESAANYICPKGKNKSFCPCAAAKKGKVTCCDVGTVVQRKDEVRLFRKKIFGNFEAHNYNKRKEALFNLLAGMVVRTGPQRHLQFTFNGVTVCRTYFKVM